MMQYALSHCDFWKQKNWTWCFLLSRLAPHLTEQSNVFQAGYFNFVQIKASVELCFNKFSDAAAKSDLKANRKKFDSELGELGTPDDLADSCMSSAMAFWKDTEWLEIWLSPYTKREAGVNEQTTAAFLCFASPEECTAGVSNSFQFQCHFRHI